MITTSNSRNNNKRSGQHKAVAIISLLACLSVVLYDAIWSFEDNDDINLYDSDYEHLRSTRRLATEEEPKFNLSNYWQDNILWHNFVSRSATATESGHQPQHDDDDVFAQPSDFAVCGRLTYPALNLTSEQYQLFASCPSQSIDPSKPILILEGHDTFGRTGNQLQSFLRAVQHAHDYDYTLGTLWGSWAMDLLLQFFLVDLRDEGIMPNDSTDEKAEKEKQWRARIEQVLCIKIMTSLEEVESRWDKVIIKSPEELFSLASHTPFVNRLALTQYTIRRLFEHSNTATSVVFREGNWKKATNMCGGIRSSVFSTDKEKPEDEQGQEGAVENEMYSVIHLRYLEGAPGKRILNTESRSSGCDPQAALDMEPEYVKSILEESGMMQHPVLVITDGQNRRALSRLMKDPDIGSNIRLVNGSQIAFGVAGRYRPHLQKDPGYSTVGGDITLATMATVFIGNPASTLSKFIGQARISLGLGNNYIYRARDYSKGGWPQWKTVCDVDCLFFKSMKRPKYRKMPGLTKVLGKGSQRVAKLMLHEQYYGKSSDRISLQDLLEHKHIERKD